MIMSFLGKKTIVVDILWKNRELTRSLSASHCPLELPVSYGAAQMFLQHFYTPGHRAGL